MSDEKIVSERVLGSSNPIARAGRKIKGSFGGIVTGIILIIIAFMLLYSSEKQKKDSNLVASLPLQQAAEVTDIAGIVKIVGKPITTNPLTPPKPENSKPVLYYEHLIEHYETVQEIYYETIIIQKDGQDIEQKIEKTRVVDKWVNKLDDKQWTSFKMGNMDIEAKNAKQMIDLSEVFFEEGPLAIKETPLPETTVTPQAIKRRETVKVLELNTDLIVIGSISNGKITAGDPFLPKLLSNISLFEVDPSE